MNQGEGQEIPRHLRAVGALVAQGQDNDQIAEALCITKHTAEKYVSELKRELGARNRVDLALRCQKLGSRLP